MLSDQTLRRSPPACTGSERPTKPCLQPFCRAADMVLPVCCPTSLQYEPTRATQHACLQGKGETGATGLEPATSGVTGHFGQRYMGDDRSAIALITSVLGRVRLDSSWLHWSGPRRAARLLPDATLACSE